MTKNRCFSPAGTEDWALLKTLEEHMLPHSLLQPQMFLNTWFPQVAFPFFFFNQVIVLIIFHHVPHGWLMTELGNLLQKQWTPGPLKNSPAVRHIGSSTRLTVLKCVQELMGHFFFAFYAFSAKHDLCRASFLWSCNSSVDIRLNFYISKKHSIACLGRFVF